MAELSFAGGEALEGDLSPRLLTAALAMTRQCWEQGMLSYTLARLGNEELAGLVVHDMMLRQSADGRLCNVEDTPAVTDSAFCIPAVWRLGRREDEAAKQAAERNLDFLLHRAERAADGTLYHMRGTGEIWADSAAFLPYSLAISGHAEAAVSQMRGILDRLYLTKSGLYAHIWDERGGGFIDARPWGVGNGWILTGLLRTSLALERGDPGFAAEAVPEARAEAAELRAKFERLLERMLSRMTVDFGFHDDLDDPESFEESETAAMVACCLYAGAQLGLLERGVLATAERIRAALLERVDARGLVRGASSSPTFDRPGTSVECQAHALLMEFWRGRAMEEGIPINA